MKKKSIKTLKTLLLICSAIMALCAIGCKKQSDEYEKEYTAEYGTEFFVPVKAEFEVFDSNGKAVPVYSNKFNINDVKGYTVKIKKGDDIVIKVRDTTAPEIITENEYIVAEAGKKTSLGEITAYDKLSGECEVTASVVSNGEKERLSANYIVPEKVGEIKVELYAEDLRGNGATKTIIVEVVEKGSRELEKITCFSNAYGVNQVSDMYGIKALYTSTERVDGKNGSLMLTATSELIFGEQSRKFRLTNLLKSNLTDTFGMYFKVKNVGTGAITLKLSTELRYSLSPGIWTDIYVSQKDFDVIKDDTDNDGISEDITQVKFELSTVDNRHVGEHSICISDMYYLPQVDSKTLSDKISKLNKTDVTSKEGYEEWLYVKRVYDSYNFSQQVNLPNGSQIEEIYLKQLFEKYADGRKEGKVVYADSKMGEYQFTSPDKSAVVSFDESKSCTVTGFEQAGSLKVNVGDGYGASLKITYPLTGTDGYSSLDVDDYGDGVYATLSFAIYPEVQEGKSVMVSFCDQKRYVTAGQWNTVKFKLKNTSLKENSLYVYAVTDVGYGSFYNNSKFYLSSMYTTPVMTAEKVDEMIENLIQQDIPAEQFEKSTEFQTTYEAFYDLSTTKRGFLKNTARFAEEIKTKISAARGIDVSQTDLKKAVWSDNPLGAYQIYAQNGTAEYTTERQYGNETGSIKLTSNRAWWTGIDLLFPLNGNDSDNVEYEFYVYIEGAKNVNVSFVAYGESETPGTTLKEGEWTKIVLRKGLKLSQNRLQFFADDWKSIFPAGVNIYFSAIYEK